MFDKPFQRVVFCLPRNSLHLYGSLIEELQEVCPNIEVNEGFPEIRRLGLDIDQESKLLLIDDLEWNFEASIN